MKLHQDANRYVLELSNDKRIHFPVNQRRQAYLVQIEGKTHVNGQHLEARDALEIVEEEIDITASETSHFMLIEIVKRAF